MKKALVLNLAIATLLFALVGCSASSGEPRSTSAEPNNAQSASQQAESSPSGSEAMPEMPEVVSDAPLSSSASAKAKETEAKKSASSKAAEKSASASAAPSASAASSASPEKQLVTPLSTESTELAKDISGLINPIIKDSGMEISATVVDLQNDRRASIDGDKRMYSASMIKLLIAATFMEQVDEGKLSLKDTYVLKDDDPVGGTGMIGGMGAGATVTYEDLVATMISVSDNTSTNVLIRSLGGMDTINKKAEKLGLTQTQLNRFMMDEEAVSRGIENYTSANDIATLLELLYRGELGSPEITKFVMGALEMQTDNSALAQGLPADTVFAHKTGTLGSVRHDGGIVESERPFIIVTLCGGSGFSQDGADSAMASIASAVNGYFADGQ